MATVTGTNNTDYLFFQGVSQHLTLTLVNPYSGELIEVDTDIIVNSQSYDGLGGFDYLMFGNQGEALFLDSSSYGDQSASADMTPKIKNIDYIIAGAGGDIVNLASKVNTYGPIRIDGGKILRNPAGDHRRRHRHQRQDLRCQLPESNLEWPRA